MKGTIKTRIYIVPRSTSIGEFPLEINMVLYDKPEKQISGILSKTTSWGGEKRWHLFDIGSSYMIHRSQVQNALWPAEVEHVNRGYLVVSHDLVHVSDNKQNEALREMEGLINATAFQPEYSAALKRPRQEVFSQRYLQQEQEDSSGQVHTLLFIPCNPYPWRVTANSQRELLSKIDEMLVDIYSWPAMKEPPSQFYNLLFLDLESGGKTHHSQVAQGAIETGKRWSPTEFILAITRQSKTEQYKEVREGVLVGGIQEWQHWCGLRDGSQRPPSMSQSDAAATLEHLSFMFIVTLLCAFLVIRLFGGISHWKQPTIQELEAAIPGIRWMISHWKRPTIQGLEVVAKNQQIEERNRRVKNWRENVKPTMSQPDWENSSDPTVKQEPIDHQSRESRERMVPIPQRSTSPSIARSEGTQSELALNIDKLRIWRSASSDTETSHSGSGYS